MTSGKSWPMPDGKDDYIELGMDGSWQWNPALGDVARFILAGLHCFLPAQSVVRQGQRSLSGKGLHQSGPLDHRTYRVFPGQWVTLRQVYHCAIDKELFEAKIKEAQAFVQQRRHGTIVIPGKDYFPNVRLLRSWKWQQDNENGTYHADHNPAVEARLQELNIKYEIEWSESLGGAEIRQRVEAVNRWYQHDWAMIDNKIRSSIDEGISVFLSIFDPAGRGESVLSTKAPGASPAPPVQTTRRPP